VSTTHTIVSSVVGFSICAKGWAAVKWPQIYLIIASWFISPILSGILSMIIFFFVRTFILRANNSLNRGYTLYPLLIGFTIWLNVFLFLYKGSPSLKIKLEWYWGFLVAVAAGIVVALILTFTVVPCMKKHVDNYKPEEEKAATDAALTRLESAVDLTSADGKKVEEEKKAGVMDSILNNTIKTDIHASLKDTESEVSKMHARAEVFDYKTEEVFKYLQIFTAIFDSFAHGANDVANSIGPLAAVWAIYKANEIPDKKVPVESWILALGGAGIVAGLGLYGYKIIAALGVKMAKVTPSRGFAIELGAAFIIVAGSFLGLPLSTTHCQVGATVGLGMMEGKGGVNWCLFANVFAGWVMTLIVGAGLSAGIFAFTAYSPSIVVSC